MTENSFEKSDDFEIKKEDEKFKSKNKTKKIIQNILFISNILTKLLLCISNIRYNQNKLASCFLLKNIAMNLSKKILLKNNFSTLENFNNCLLYENRCYLENGELQKINFRLVKNFFKSLIQEFKLRFHDLSKKRNFRIKSQEVIENFVN